MVVGKYVVFGGLTLTPFLPDKFHQCNCNIISIPCVVRLTRKRLMSLAKPHKLSFFISFLPKEIKEKKKNNIVRLHHKYVILK